MADGRITIGQRAIGDGHPCFIIAEAGINHNGDTALAAELVDAAAAAGADAIKFQTHFPEHEMLRGGATAAYVGESLFDLLTRTALSRDAHVALRDRAKAKGIMFLSTPFSREAADYLETLGRVHFRLGNLDEALRLYEQALALVPADVDVKRRYDEVREAASGS